MSPKSVPPGTERCTGPSMSPITLPALTALAAFLSGCETTPSQAVDPAVFETFEIDLGPAVDGVNVGYHGKRNLYGLVGTPDGRSV